MGVDMQSYIRTMSQDEMVELFLPFRGWQGAYRGGVERVVETYHIAKRLRQHEALLKTPAAVGRPMSLEARPRPQSPETSPWTRCARTGLGWVQRANKCLLCSREAEPVNIASSLWR